jgi:hypothetical protein
LKASQAGYHYSGPLRKGEQKLKLSIQVCMEILFKIPQGVSAIRNCNSLFEIGILQMVFNCSHSVCGFSTNSTEVYMQKALTEHMAIQGH